MAIRKIRKVSDSRVVSLVAQGSKFLLGIKLLKIKTKHIEKASNGDLESNGYHGGRREENRRREGGSRLREERRSQEVEESNGRREEDGEELGEKAGGGEKNLSRKWKNTLASVSAVEKMR